MKSPQGTSDDSDLVKARIRAIRAAHPGNLMARHFDADYFASLDAPKRDRLLRIIGSGVENPDSQMGAYARDAEDYDEFAALLDPMIRDYHGIAEGEDIAQQHDWSGASSRCDLAAIDPALSGVSMRVRVGRNLGGFPLPGAMTQAQRLEFEALVAEAFAVLREDPQFGGHYLSLTPGLPHTIGEAEYQRRVAAHQMFKDMSGDKYLRAAGISADWPYGRGMYVSGAEDFLVWVGEEDQLRIMAMARGGDVARLFARLRDGLERLGGLLPPFAHSPRYGYITSCPTNLGTAMRASLHLPLPGLTAGGADLGAVKKAASGLRLTVRGAAGEHSGAGQGGLVDISPRARLRITETGIMRCLYEGAAALWSLEQEGDAAPAP